MTRPTATTAAVSTLPNPTGRHQVGRTSLELVDATRPERYTADPDARRELVLWIWYPATPASHGRRAEHLPGPWLPVADMIGVDIAGASTHAIVDAPLSSFATTYPVLFLSPSGFSPLLLSALAEELASNGYVVVGINHTYETAVTPFADGRVVPMNPAALGGALGPVTGSFGDVVRARADLCEYKADDFGSVLDHLEGLGAAPAGITADRLDLSRVAAIGHSFGGDAALTWCGRDDRCRAAANLDGGLWSAIGTTGVARPVLQILADHPELSMTGADAVAAGLAEDADRYEAERQLVLGGWRTVDRAGRPARTVQVSGATHVSFMDVPFLPSRPDNPAGGLLAASSIDPTRMWRVTSDVLLAFFAEHLDGVPAALLDGPRPTHPELMFGPP